MIEPATSGGPLLGADGRVVAVTTQLSDEGGDASYAIPIDTVRDVLAQLEEGHKVIRPYLGLHGRTGAGGVEVVEVYAGGPADRAGLQVGDTIETIDGRPATTLGRAARGGRPPRSRASRCSCACCATAAAATSSSGSTSAPPRCPARSPVIGLAAWPE